MPSLEISKEGFGRLVWVRDASKGFVLGRLRDIGSETMTVEPLDGNPHVVASYNDVLPAEEDRKKDVDDNCALMYLNEATLLNNCRLRYMKKQIYTYIANILISINPYEQIHDLYSSPTIKKYQGKSLGQLAPHIFAIADKAYRDMKRFYKSQSIIVSGESGAGKTESQKYILRYLCELWGSTAGTVQQRILETNPILEAFGNAKTLRNNNSSRFGKFVEIHFGSKYMVAGGFVSHYLLEKSRICKQQPGERNYHIFYQLIAGADAQLAKKLALKDANSFNYLKGCAQFFTSSSTAPKIPKERRSSKKSDLHDGLVDDYADFQKLRSALLSIGLNANDLNNVFQIIAALLHLGNVHFVDNADDRKGGCMVDAESEESLQLGASLLGIDPVELRHGLISRIMQSKAGAMGTIIRVPLKTYEAAAARDALAKAVYSKLFDSIVAHINKCIPFGDSVAYIGVLDIAGFEFFTVNSFEQFCINYCNEKLQQFFNDRILKEEQELYEKEGLHVPHIEYCDNQDCIELFEQRTSGLLDMLDEEARLPCPSAQHFTAAVHKQHLNHFRLATPRKSKLREHRDMRDDEGFLIRHYAGSVCYQTALFLEKNNDALHASLEMLVENSSITFIQGLFAKKESEDQSVGNRGRTTSSNKLITASVSSKFRAQLRILLKKLETTGTHFVRCIKPNSEMRAGLFEGPQILSQLECSGMMSVLKLMHQGYPSRTVFADLYETYQSCLPPHLARLHPRLFCKCLFRALGLNEHDYKFGLTKVFFRPGKFAEFDQMIRQDKEQMKRLIDKVQSWLLRFRWRKAQYGALSCIKLKNKILYRAAALIKIQSATRGYLARKEYRARLLMYRRALALSRRQSELTDVMKRLSAASQKKWSATITETETYIDNFVHAIKMGGLSREGEMESRYNTAVRKLDSVLSSLRQQVASDERERIKQMEEKMRLQKEKEERERREAEQLEKIRAEKRLLEERRQREEEALLKQQAELEAQRKAQEEEREKRARHQEQMRLDEELAKRLAHEDHRVHVVESCASLSATEKVTKSKGQYDLSEWKYVDLRDAVNTTTDIKFIEAVRDEFHRRLRMLQQWKERNQACNEHLAPRAPISILEPAGNVIVGNRAQTSSNIQRYFKVPFVHVADHRRGIAEYYIPLCFVWHSIQH
uniref:Myosin motor domain-containing protein n=1 Tax=Parascaris univalens TaxID=6257 RepID=A0A915AE15_PARUN